MKRIGLTVLAVIGAGDLLAFTLQGPLQPWMTPRLGYDLNAANYGGPMNIGEEYRWNVPTVYYGYTPAFLNYFGARGAAEVAAAFNLLNDTVPQASLTVPDAYPLTSQRMNFKAMALGIVDLKSFVLSTAMQQMGLANPSRYVFTLRNRWTTTQPDTTNFFTIRRNFDPSTWRTTSYINGVLWTYSQVFDVSASQSFVTTTPVDPLAHFGYLNAPVASGWQNGDGLLPGGFWTTLTRDDIGGLGYIYRPNNYNIESYGAGIGGGTGGAWGVAPGTNTVTNLFVNNALRGGLDKVTFEQVQLDSLLGFFTPFTNFFQDTFITNGQQVIQNMQRTMTAPDILFDAADLQGADAGDTIIFASFGFVPWVPSPDATNAAGVNAGPGVIDGGAGNPAFTVTFNSASELLLNTYPFDNLDEISAARFLLYGSFNGTTNDPFVYPVGIEIQQLEALVLQSGSVANAWGPAPLGNNQTNVNTTQPGAGQPPIAP